MASESFFKISWGRKSKSDANISSNLLSIMEANENLLKYVGNGQSGANNEAPVMRTKYGGKNNKRLYESSFLRNQLVTNVIEGVSNLSSDNSFTINSQRGRSSPKSNALSIPPAPGSGRSKFYKSERQKPFLLGPGPANLCSIEKFRSIVELPRPRKARISGGIHDQGRDVPRTILESGFSVEDDSEIIIPKPRIINKGTSLGKSVKVKPIEEDVPKKRRPSNKGSIK